MQGLRLAFLRDIEYNRKLQAQALVDRGVPDALLYFWFNCVEDNYHNKQAMLFDADRFKEKHPEFSNDIKQWTEH